MAVFPQKTSWAIPKCLQPLIDRIDSPIADYFPIDFVIDTLGKKFAWLGEVLLPFIEEDRLLRAMEGYEKELTPQEQVRNRLGSSLLFFNGQHVLKKIAGKGQKVCQKEAGI